MSGEDCCNAMFGDIVHEDTDIVQSLLVMYITNHMSNDPRFALACTFRGVLFQVQMLCSKLVLVVYNSEMTNWAAEGKLRHFTKAMETLYDDIDFIWKAHGAVAKQDAIVLPEKNPVSYVYSIYTVFVCHQLLSAKDDRSSLKDFIRFALAEPHQRHVRIDTKYFRQLHLDNQKQLNGLDMRALIMFIEIHAEDLQVPLIVLGQEFVASLENQKIVLQGLRRPIPEWASAFKIEELGVAEANKLVPESAEGIIEYNEQEDKVHDVRYIRHVVKAMYTERLLRRIMVQNNSCLRSSKRTRTLYD